DPVLGDVQAASHRALAQGDVVRLGAGEVLEDVAELVRRDDLQVDLHARVRPHAGARLAGGLDGFDQREAGKRGGQRGRVGGGGDDVDVLDRVDQPAQRAGHLD